MFLLEAPTVLKRNVWLGQQNGGRTPLTYQAFCKVIGTPPAPVAAPSQIPSPSQDLNNVELVAVPTLEELGYLNLDEVFITFWPWNAAASDWNGLTISSFKPLCSENKWFLMMSIRVDLCGDHFWTLLMPEPDDFTGVFPTSRGWDRSTSKVGRFFSWPGNKYPSSCCTWNKITSLHCWLEFMLIRLRRFVSDCLACWPYRTCTVMQKWVCDFEKPKGDPTAFIKPATTVLSPYLKACTLDGLHR